MLAIIYTINSLDQMIEKRICRALLFLLKTCNIYLIYSKIAN